MAKTFQFRCSLFSQRFPNLWRDYGVLKFSGWVFSFRKQPLRNRGPELEAKAIQNHNFSKIANSSTWNNQYDIEKNASLVSAPILIFLEFFFLKVSLKGPIFLFIERSTLSLTTKTFQNIILKLFTFGKCWEEGYGSSFLVFDFSVICVVFLFLADQFSTPKEWGPFMYSDVYEDPRSSTISTNLDRP